MARRRKKKGNSLLMRIFLVTLVLHAIALPIAAHYGAFKNLKRGFGDARIVMLSTNIKDQPDKPKEKAKEKPKQVKDAKKASNGAKSSAKASNNLPQPKVVTSGPAAGIGEGTGPSAESGTGTAGKVPDAGKPAETKPEPEVKKEPIEPPKSEPTKKPDPPKIEPVKTEPVKTPEPKAKKLVEAVVAEAPEPEIPDELRSEPLDKTLIVEAQIDTGGHPTDVTVVSSTGVKELDRIGLETAKKYRFKPAPIDGVASEQHVRFKIFFKVE